MLKDEKDKKVPPLTLQKTKYLPSLEGATWNKTLGKDNQLLIRRSKIGVNIILKESSQEAKYELFQRLNTGGSFLSDQELRNVSLMMVNPDFYAWINKLASSNDFKTCVALSENQERQQYNLELVVRYLVFRRRKESKLRGLGDLSEFLTEAIITMAQSKKFDSEMEQHIFKKTFSKLANVLQDNSFHKYDSNAKRYLGPFLISIFEVLAIGLGYHLENEKFNISKSRVLSISRDLWKDQKFTKSTGSGISAASRIPFTIPYGRRVLAS